jgi:2-hydroxychromene-2-carboxylate isomerase
VQRALCYVQLEHPAKLTAAFDALYRTFWVEGNPIQKPEIITAALQNVFSEAEVKDIMAKTGTPEVKKAMAANTDLAFKEGAFGMPWFVATSAKGETDRTGY